MNNKKSAFIVITFIAIVLLLAGIIGFFSHIPFLGKPLVFIFSLLLVIFVIVFFAVLSKRRKK